MTPSSQVSARTPPMGELAGSALRSLASLKLAIALMVLLAAVLVAAIFVEAAEGRDYVGWYVYHSSWFAALLGTLAANILAAARACASLGSGSSGASW